MAGMDRRDFLCALAAGAAAGRVGRAAAAPESGRVSLRWSEGPHFPSFIKGGAFGAVGGTLVYAAGMTYPWRETEAVWAFEPGTADWVPLPPLPEGRAYTQGVGALDSLVVVGGRRQRRSRAEVFRLSRSGSGWRWETLPALAQPRGVAAVAAVDALVVAAGGGDWDRIRGGSFLPREVTLVEGLDLRRTDRGWRALAPFPAGPRVGAAAATLGGKVYVFGGYDCWWEGEQRQKRHFADAYCYDPAGDRWEECAAMPAAAHGAAAAPLDDRRIAIAGGYVQIPGADGRTYNSLAVDAKRKVVLGQYCDGVLVYDTVARAYSWAEGKMPWGLNDLRLAALGGKLYAVGGENVDVTLSNTTDAFMIGERSGGA
jgi:hypothetical protein